MSRGPVAAGAGTSGAVLALVLAGGCVERTVRITSEPSGALVHLNDREVGRTPVETRFVHYGTFDVRLVRDGFDPVSTVGEARSPWWDTVPLDFIAAILPIPLESRVDWHFELEPARDEAAGMVERAMELRRRGAEPMLGMEAETAMPVVAGEDGGGGGGGDGRGGDVDGDRRGGGGGGVDGGGDGRDGGGDGDADDGGDGRDDDSNRDAMATPDAPG